MYRAPHKCSVCGGKLTVTGLSCDTCGTVMTGRFDGCPFCSLSAEEMRFLLIFLKNRGSIKDVEREMGISYPTVRAALDNLIAALGLHESAPASASAADGDTAPARGEEEARPSRRGHAAMDTARARKEILRQLSDHRITADEAAKKLREL